VNVQTWKELLMKIAHAAGYATVLLLGVSGSAQALPGTGTVDSGDIKNGQVKTVDLAGNAVTSGKVAPNAITGADVAEGTLGTVPNAAKVAGATISRFVRVTPSGAQVAPTKAAAAGGLEIWVGCDQDDFDPIDYYAWIVLKSSKNDAYVTITAASQTSSQVTEVSDLDPGEEVVITLGSLTAGTADVVYSTPQGSVASASLGWRGVATTGCLSHGLVTGG